MPTALQTFEKSLDLSEVVLAHDVGVITRKISLTMLRELVLRTPVDKGQARGNWFVTVGAPGTETSDERRPAAAMSEGASKVESAAPFATIYVQNALPYILALEDGHSQQAPAGMMKQALQVAEAAFS